MSGGDIIHGTVASVDATPLGSELAAAANIGDTLLTLVDVADFWAGTRLNLNGVIYPYTTVDDTAQTVLLSTPVTTAGVVSDAVQVWDNRANLPAVTTEATVIAQGDSSTGDPIMAVVAPGVIPFLPLGVRDPANAGDSENVMLEEVNGVWHVKALAGSSMAPTLTAATVQTAAEGLRMWMIGQDPTSDAFEGLYLSSGLPAETQPGHLVLNWDTPTTGPPDSTTGMVSFTIAPPWIGAVPNPAYIGMDQSLSSGLQSRLTLVADVISIGAGAGAMVLESQGLLIGNGTPIQGVDHGKVVSATTTSSGGVIQAHILGSVPSSVQVTPFMASPGVSCRVTAMTSTDFTIGFFTTSTGAPLPSTNVGYTWLAIA